ncbi:MAG TPA: hypothetical protein VE173_16465, partial [Longimicrobiales bacterium]|nr:hypothetical protein [Longimicrobiales bacterium]
MTLRYANLARATLVACAVLAWAPPPAAAQDDVEMLGRIHGTTPPRGYYAVKARNPDAFTLRRAWFARNPSLQQVSAGRVPGEPPRYRFRGAGGVAPGEREVPGAEGLRTAPGSLASAVDGTFHFPLVLGYFADDTLPVHTPAEIQQEFFDGPNSRYRTIEDYYAEVSGGRIDFQGE